MKDAIEQIKNSVESLHNRMNEAEERISELEDTFCYQGKQTKAGTSWVKLKKYSRTGTIERPNIRVVGVPEGIERETWIKSIFNEIIKENFPNLEKELGNNIEEGHRTPSRVGEK